MDSRIFTFEDSDFDDLTYNVHKISLAHDPLEQFPLFKRFPEFKVNLDHIKTGSWFRYIVYMYDPNSPLILKISDIPTRKFNALYYAGIYPDPKTNKHLKPVLEAVQGLNHYANGMIFRFASVVKNSDYLFYVGLQEGYFKLIKDGLDDTKKLDAAEKMKKKIDAYRQDLLNYDKSIVLQEDFFDFVVEQQLNLRPEEIAELTANGEDPIPDYVNPYELSSRKIKWTVYLE